MKHMLFIVMKGNGRMNFFEKEPKFIQEERSKLRDYISRGISAFLVILLLFVYKESDLEFLSFRTKKFREVK